MSDIPTASNRLCPLFRALAAMMVVILPVRPESADRDMLENILPSLKTLF
jgi:hypothetical protein